MHLHFKMVLWNISWVKEEISVEIRIYLELTNRTIICKHLWIQFGENWVQVHGLHLFYLYNVLRIYNYFNMKSSRVAQYIHFLCPHALNVTLCGMWICIFYLNVRHLRFMTWQMQGKQPQGVKRRGRPNTSLVRRDFSQYVQQRGSGECSSLNFTETQSPQLWQRLLGTTHLISGM